jgi:hypothetical protein
MQVPMKQRFPTATAALSLMELAIVIAIIGFIAGAVFVGLGLGRSAEIRNYARNLATYEAAVLTFKDKFSSVPGDMNNAVDIWGAAGGSGSDITCQNTPTLTEATCNGNGDFIMSTSVVAMDETYRAWQHLRNAELLEGRFMGSQNGITLERLLEDVLPKSETPNIGYQFRPEDKATLGWMNAPEGATPFLSIRVAVPVAGIPLQLGNHSVSPHLLFRLDEKLDDSLPGTGKVFGVFAGSVNCFTSNDAAIATYNAANETTGCMFHYDLTK